MYTKIQRKTSVLHEVFTVSGTLAEEHVTVVVCHLPSRGAGSYFRELAGKEVKALKDSLLVMTNVKILIMGDMNDDPTDKKVW